MKKHICFIELMPFPTTVGGGITHLKELAKALIKKNYKVSIITSKPPKQFKLEKGLKSLNLYHVGLKHKKFEDFTGLKKPYYFVWRVFFELSFVSGAIKVLKKINPDIINTQSFITTSLPCSLTGKNFVVTSHGIYSHGFKRLYKLKKERIVSGIGAKIYKIIENFNLKRCSLVICLGKETYDYYSKYKKSVIIPNGVDIEKFKPGKKQRNLIISVGRFTKQKQVDRLILAMDYLKDYKLLVIGLGPLEPEIRKLCQSRKNCQFLGYKNQDQISKLMSKASFTILPSEFEGLPIAMLEAMSSGVIPVATKVGDIQDVISEGKNGFFLKDNKPRTIAETMKKINKRKLARISKTARETIEKNYSWDKISDKYLAAYNGK